MDGLPINGRASARIFLLLAIWAAVPFCEGSVDREPAYAAQVINPDLEGGLLLPGGRTMLLWGSDATILRSTDGMIWSHADTPGQQDLAHVATNADGGVLIAVGAQGTLLRSVDEGRRWQAVSSGEEADLKSVVFHSPSGAWVAAGARGRILRSTDAGKTWKTLPTGIETDFQTLFVDPQTRQILLGGDEGLVGSSMDGGVSWNVTKVAMPEPLTPVTAYRRFGKLLLASSALGRFLASHDDAQSWDLMQAESKAYWTDSGFDARHGAIVLVGHNGDVLRSADQGESWQLTAIEIDGRRNFLSGIHYDGNGSLIVVGDGGTVVRSTDGGANWSRASTDVREGLRGLVAGPSRITAFGHGGLVVNSTDAGSHWKYARNSLAVYLREVARAPGGALLASSNLGELIRSEDGGRSWKLLEVPYPNVNTPPDLRALLPAPANDVMIAAGPPGAILRSNPDASRWQVVHWSEIEEERAFPWMLVDYARNLLVAVEARGLMQVSRNGGRNWSAVQIDVPKDEFPLWQGVVHVRTGTLLVGGKGGIAARSTDGARTWSRVDTGTTKNLYGSFAAEAGEALFLMGQDGTLLHSRDLGLNWRSIPSGSSSELRRMVRDPRSGALICFGAHGALLRSEDQGESWSVLPPLTKGVLREALIEPRSGNLLLVGGKGSLLRSADGGRQWQVLPAHTSRHFTGAEADSRSGDLLLVGERIVRLVRQSPP
jgi:photosystem II stability/assembly factor-like uncharacterized protein